jgi:hypothetical protein
LGISIGRKNANQARLPPPPAAAARIPRIVLIIGMKTIRFTDTFHLDNFAANE